MSNIIGKNFLNILSAILIALAFLGIVWPFILILFFAFPGNTRWEPWMIFLSFNMGAIGSFLRFSYLKVENDIFLKILEWFMTVFFASFLLFFCGRSL